jgi:hypothetical protein
LAKLTSQSAKPTAPNSAQVGRADFQLAKLTFLVLAAADASSDDLTPLVDWFLESNIMQIKDMHFSNMINKVENTNILLKFQSGHTISIAASIRDILANSGNRPIENSNLFVGDKINLDSIGQHIMPYGKADGDTSSKLKLPMSNCKGVAEWIDNKSDLFVSLALKPTPQKNWLKKSKYIFDFIFCDHVFDILLKGVAYKMLSSIFLSLSSLYFRKKTSSCLHQLGSYRPHSSISTLSTDSMTPYKKREQQVSLSSKAMYRRYYVPRNPSMELQVLMRSLAKYLWWKTYEIMIQN